MTSLRAFIAIDLSAEISTKISEVLILLRKRLGDSAVRWVPAENIHLTLKFLGNVPEGQIAQISQAIQRATVDLPSFEIRIAGLGAFPRLKQPRVIWLGVENSPALLALQSRIEGQVSPLGYPAETRPFKGHLTLGRVSDRAEASEVKTIAETLQYLINETRERYDLGLSSVTDVYLYRSDLRPSGAIYTHLFSAPLTPKTFHER